MKRFGLLVTLTLLFSPLGYVMASPPVRSAKQQTNEKKVVVLFYKPSCPYCQKVLRYMEKLGITLPLKDTNSAEQREYLRKEGGKTQVPCLFIDGKALYESDAIIEWLGKNKNDIQMS